MADDKLAAELAAIRDAGSAQARHLLYRLDRLQRKSPDHLGLLGWDEEETDKGIADLGRLLKAGPLLLAALDVALKPHRRSPQPAHGPLGGCHGKHFCVGCSQGFDHSTWYVAWPCPPYEAILAALTGKAADGNGG